MVVTAHDDCFEWLLGHLGSVDVFPTLVVAYYTWTIYESYSNFLCVCMQAFYSVEFFPHKVNFQEQNRLLDLDVCH